MPTLTTTADNTPARDASVRERPILFSGPMVRAILDGSKTQTRRVLKCQPLYKSAMYYVMPDDCPKAWQDCSNVIPLCPYGQPGDRLWVRETWMHARTSGYDAPEDGREIPAWHRATDEGLVDGPWRPSIFMPRGYCRLVLEITDVRVERLQAITDRDCAAEGCETSIMGHGYPVFRTEGRDKYRRLWDSLNAKRGYAWDVNPWVWVLSFRRVDA